MAHGLRIASECAQHTHAHTHTHVRAHTHAHSHSKREIERERERERKEKREREKKIQERGDKINRREIESHLHAITLPHAHIFLKINSPR